MDINSTIIQFGIEKANGNPKITQLPIAYTTNTYTIVGTCYSTAKTWSVQVVTAFKSTQYPTTTTSFSIGYANSNTTEWYTSWITIGY